jgi:myosin heavy subunit
LLKGANQELKSNTLINKDFLLIDGTANDYRFTKNSNKSIDGIDDYEEFKSLRVI